MGRETKLLLGLLALLAGVFMGLLSMKLLVPRPPAGTGPDVHADIATATEPHDLVEPPRFDAPARRPPEREIPAAEPYPVRQSRFAAPAGAEAPVASLAAEPPRQDPFVTAASLERPDDAAPRPATLAAGTTPEARDVAARGAEPSSRAPGPAYVTRAGDSWWSLAERAYGDGRLYRALFAWNRALDPRVSLVPGTSIEIPTAERLQAAWPTLLPTH